MEFSVEFSVESSVETSADFSVTFSVWFSALLFEESSVTISFGFSVAFSAIFFSGLAAVLVLISVFFTAAAAAFLAGTPDLVVDTAGLATVDAVFVADFTAGGFADLVATAGAFFSGCAVVLAGTLAVVDRGVTPLLGAGAAGVVAVVAEERVFGIVVDRTGAAEDFLAGGAVTLGLGVTMTFSDLSDGVIVDVNLTGLTVVVLPGSVDDIAREGGGDVLTVLAVVVAVFTDVLTGGLASTLLVVVD